MTRSCTWPADRQRPRSFWLLLTRDPLLATRRSHPPTSTGWGTTVSRRCPAAAMFSAERSSGRYPAFWSELYGTLPCVAVAVI